MRLEAFPILDPSGLQGFTLKILPKLLFLDLAPLTWLEAIGGVFSSP